MPKGDSDAAAQLLKSALSASDEAPPHDLFAVSGGPRSSAALTALDHADCLVLIVGAGIDAVYAASLAVDRLAQTHRRLLDHTVVAVERGRGPIHLPTVERHFLRRCRSVMQLAPASLPFAPHTEDHSARAGSVHRGADVPALSAMAPAARCAWLELAIAVAADLTVLADPPTAR